MVQPVIGMVNDLVDYKRFNTGVEIGQPVFGQVGLELHQSAIGQLGGTFSAGKRSRSALGRHQCRAAGNEKR